MPPNGTNPAKDDISERSGCRKKEENGLREEKTNVSSLVDELLCDIYGNVEGKRKSSGTTCDLSWQDSDGGRCSVTSRRREAWADKDLKTIKEEKFKLEKLIAEEGNKLVKHLKRKNFLLLKREANCDVITAYIQAFSAKTREDTKMRFSLTPGAETGFSQWLDAMKMVAQLPGGMPAEFRTKLWLQLSEKHLSDQNVDWEKAEAVIFNEWTNPDDEELGVQIVKDLHRTGCSLFCGEQEHNQAVLKRVLLAYARWNKNVGYCQGFNMLAALILQVMEKDEKNSVKVMIYLIEGVLPESYFANNLRGLSVDMAVFRDLLRLRLPKLSRHLEALQHDTNSGTSYEPPLTNVFTMQWFLTLFSNCLPQQTVLRVWDLVFLYGNEVLLRTALAIWGILQDRVITVESADEFYSIMGVVTREMLEFGLMDANTLVKMIAMVDPFPNELQELREKYLYNISPWTQSVQTAAKKGIRLFYSDPDDQDDTEDEDKIALATAYGVFRRRESTGRELQVSGPTLDISVLKQQYAKLRQRQRQAHIIITAACSSNLPASINSGPSVSVNHLLMGKSALVNKGRRIGPPEGSIPPPSYKKGEEKESKKQKIVISGETLEWKDAEKRKITKGPSKSKGDIVGRNEKDKIKKENEEGRVKTNHDRMEDVVTEASVLDSLKRREVENESSGSSTSTELCDDEFHRCSDSEEGTNSDASTCNPRSRTPRLFPSGKPSTLDEGSPEAEAEAERNDISRMEEIKTVALEVVKGIEEEIQRRGEPEKDAWKTKSDEGGTKSAAQEVKTINFDNTNVILGKDKGDNILKREPAVPIRTNVIENRKEAEEQEVERSENSQRKTLLGLNVIRENLEMLNKFSQKLGSSSFETEDKAEIDEKPVLDKNEKTNAKEKPEQDEKAEVGKKGEVDNDVMEDGKKKTVDPTLNTPERSAKEMEKKPEVMNLESKQRVGDPQKTEMRNKMVEKAISPVVLEKTPITVDKANKEVNTEITFGTAEVDMMKLRMEEEDFRSRVRGEDEKDTFGKKEDMDTRKSDWELKMRRIAELETTTLETLKIGRKLTGREERRTEDSIPEDEFQSERSRMSEIQWKDRGKSDANEFNLKPEIERLEVRKSGRMPWLSTEKEDKIQEEEFVFKPELLRKLIKIDATVTESFSPKLEISEERKKDLNRKPMEDDLNKTEEDFMERERRRTEEEEFMSKLKMGNESTEREKRQTEPEVLGLKLDLDKSESRKRNETSWEPSEGRPRGEAFGFRREEKKILKETNSRLLDEMEDFLSVKPEIRKTEIIRKFPERGILEDEDYFSKLESRKVKQKSVEDDSFFLKPEIERTEARKLKASARSFDAITSRTEMLLGNVEFNRSTDQTSPRKRWTSPDLDYRKRKDSTRKFRELIEECYGSESPETMARKPFHSSPTSPERAFRTRGLELEFLLPRKYRGEDEEEVDAGSKVAKRKSSGERIKSEARTEFNPFPKRTSPRPKELGVKLGLYPEESRKKS